MPIDEPRNLPGDVPAGAPGAPRDAPADLDALVASWRGWMQRHDAVNAADLDELESHLLDTVDHFVSAGLTVDEAFLVAVKRLGGVDDLSREYAREHSERLWKQLVLSGDDDGPAGSAGSALPGGDAEAAGRRLPWYRRANGLPVALLLGAGAGLAVKAVELATGDPSTVALNIAVIVLPFLALWFAWRRRPSIAVLAIVGVVFAGVGLALNLYPFIGSEADEAGTTVAAISSATGILAMLGSIVALWLATGLAYVGDDWRDERARMDFVRFSGEWFVYYVLIALGGGALSMLTVAVFASIGVDVMPFVGEWVLPLGAAGAVLVAAWLVGAKQRVIENIAPVLTKVFTPLFTIMMLALVVAALVQWNLVDASRDLLIAFDAVLVVVVGLLVYSISARDPLLPPGWFDRLQALMLATALVLDAIVLVAMLARTGEFGFSANKTASLGLNLILLVNLVWALRLQLGFLRRHTGFAALERWQTTLLPVYFAWAAILVVVFPPVFGFA
ncbi:permease prefix domain 1-containing protein [Agromyces endophyticus]|uniref:permease prefix domain 1-containing protein n=1 Tax=Agromyces sp. H17E-10 TaxID=2932244 RepID=UPI001FD13388|nr:permease prefix domain 1-containing protein [Agromyces sp. H17E-10]UOQ90378.1 permease prefix domain 1-containing protein [Agromyces sp. H17E-10]